jgi:hypothetical protein
MFPFIKALILAKSSNVERKKIPTRKTGFIRSKPAPFFIGKNITLVTKYRIKILKAIIFVMCGINTSPPAMATAIQFQFCAAIINKIDPR